MYDECVALSMRFPQKLWKIVNDCKSGSIRWSTNGVTILLDYKKFQDEYLGNENPIFKTSNITSFIRQLNLYGFRKVTSHNRDPLCNSNNPDTHEFLHENFRSGRYDLLGRVCRKAANVNNRHGKKLQRNADYGTRRTEVRPMTRLQICRYALTRALEQATGDYRREKMLDRVREDGPATDRDEAVRARRRYAALHARRDRVACQNADGWKRKDE